MALALTELLLFAVAIGMGRTFVLTGQEGPLRYDETILESAGDPADEGTVVLRSLRPGVTRVWTGETSRTIFAHSTGLLTADTFFGPSRADPVFACMVFVMLLAFFLFSLWGYVKGAKQSLCQYKNLSYLGWALFSGTLLTLELCRVLVADHVLSAGELAGQVLTGIDGLLRILAPVFAAAAVFLVGSNIMLLRREGVTWRYALGILLSGGCAVLYVLPGMLRPRGTFPVLTGPAAALVQVMTYYLFCMLVSGAVCGTLSAQYVPRTDKDYILILGCQIRRDGSLTVLLRGRSDRALAFGRMQEKKTGKPICYVPCGGQGKDEIMSEAEAIRTYLIRQGVGEENILMEDRSANTRESLRNAREMIQARQKEAKAAFSTTDFHVFRTGCIAREMGWNVEGVGQRTKIYFSVNAWIREFVACMYAQRKAHLMAALLLILLVLSAAAVNLMNQ